METDISAEDLRPRVLQQALEQISSYSDNDSSGFCVICLGGLIDPCEARPCRHNHFDFICLVTWLQQRAICPLCNSDVHEVIQGLTSDGKPNKIYTVPRSSEDSNSSHEQIESLIQSAPRRNIYADRSSARDLPHEDAAIRRRHFVYRHGLYSLHIGSNKRQPAESMHRELSPRLFATHPELQSRARIWLKRELRVFQHWNTSGDAPHEIESVRKFKYGEARFLIEYIIAILKSTDIQGSTLQAENMIAQFLDRKHTRLLLHELKAWLRSPYDSLSAWDNAVQYNIPETYPEIPQSMAGEAAKAIRVELKYHEPVKARKPPPSQDYRLYVFKGDELQEVIKLWERTVWLFGREELVVDVPTLHPSCSGQHAALQFQDEKNEYSGPMNDQARGSTKLYLFDLGSTNGTTLNDQRIEAREYVELRHKDIIRFGESRREYVVIIPPD